MLSNTVLPTLQEVPVPHEMNLYHRNLHSSLKMYQCVKILIIVYYQHKF